jgi:CheY-like chemotaxis protein
LTAANLKEACEAFAKRTPQGHQLGGESGLDLISRMQRQAEIREIPVIAVTAHAMVTEQDRILRAGCRACLSKPIEFRVLRNELERWLVPAKTSQIDS